MAFPILFCSLSPLKIFKNNMCKKMYSWRCFDDLYAVMKMWSGSMYIYWQEGRGKIVIFARSHWIGGIENSYFWYWIFDFIFFKFYLFFFNYKNESDWCAQKRIKKSSLRWRISAYERTCPWYGKLISWWFKCLIILLG